MTTTTTKRSVFTVTWSRRAGWCVRAAWFTVGPYPNKVQAVGAGRTIARRAKPSQLRVKGRNGRIQTEYTYGQDPRRFVG
jgi:hypothetical protein